MNGFFGKLKRILVKKVGPGKLKAPVWLLALVGGAIVYWYERRKAAASGSPATAVVPGTGVVTGAPVTPDSGGGGGGSQPIPDPLAPAAFDPSGPLPNQDLQTSVDNYTPPAAKTPVGAGKGGGLSRSVSLGEFGGVPSAAQVAALSSPTLSRAEFENEQAAYAYANPTMRVKASTPNFALAAEAKTQGAVANGAQVPIAFGGVASVKRTANGLGTLTTYESGRVVEQVPGKSAFVVSAGPGAAPVPEHPAAATVSKPRDTPAPAPSRTATPAAAPTPAAVSHSEAAAKAAATVAAGVHHAGL